MLILLDLHNPLHFTQGMHDFNLPHAHPLEMPILLRFLARTLRPTPGLHHNFAPHFGLRVTAFPCISPTPRPSCWPQLQAGILGRWPITTGNLGVVPGAWIS